MQTQQQKLLVEHKGNDAFLRVASCLQNMKSLLVFLLLKTDLFRKENGR